MLLLQKLVKSAAVNTNSYRTNLIFAAAQSQSFAFLRTVAKMNKAENKPTFRLIDIGSNLTDEMYSGVYNGTSKHEPDLEKVLNRAWSVGLEKIIVTAGNLAEAKKCVDLCNKDDRLFTTLGVHPTRCSEFISDPEKYVADLKCLYDLNKGKIVALGEFGLDYERTQFCDIETQKKFFVMQLRELGSYTKLPLFLHCRGAAKDLIEILQEHNVTNSMGVVHSFDGTWDELDSFLNMGFSIGINGCSLKTEENCKVVKEIPIERLLLETDSPWCGIRPSHFSSKFIKTKFDVSKKNWSPDAMYKTRNEPVTLINIVEIVARIKDIDEAYLVERVYNNTVKLFFPEQAL